MGIFTPRIRIHGNKAPAGAAARRKCHDHHKARRLGIVDPGQCAFAMPLQSDNRDEEPVPISARREETAHAVR
jgi:hypothetical protein